MEQQKLITPVKDDKAVSMKPFIIWLTVIYMAFQYVYGYQLWKADQTRIGALELETKALRTNIDLLYAVEAVRQ